MPQQRWQIFPPQPQQAQGLAEATQLSPLLAQVLINRGIYTPEQAWEFLDPETQQLPSPLDEFPDLPLSLELLADAIATGQRIAICGDYDADGMTSTALLLRALRALGARVDYAIPSRMQEGYGINRRIVEEFAAEGIACILTVDNGIAAYEPIARARELGLTVIITDHHDLPERLPPAQAILNPKLLPSSSPYRGVAGVGVAYILAVCLAQVLQKHQDLTASLLELFTLGTIADLAPLVGVNRRWVRRGLGLLPRSRIPGIQALIEVAGLGQQQMTLKPEAIGFRLGPRINAVGRIADPQIVIDMLTTDDVGVALQRAMQCEEANTLRQRMCELIEAQAVDWCEQQQQAGKLDLAQERVLVVVQPNWHHGVIGIVASRLVERYGVPVFIGTYEDADQKDIRGSARGIPEFNVFEALQACDDLLDKYGGHRAAGGFSFPQRNLRQVQTRLRKFARQQLQPGYLKPLVSVDVQANLADIGLDLYGQIDRLHPCGIENADPVFWTPQVKVLEQQIIGKDRKHLKLTVVQTEAEGASPISLRAIAWRWGEYHPLPRELDIAYKIRLNEWQGKQSVELELIGVRLPRTPSTGIPPWSVAAETLAAKPVEKPPEKTPEKPSVTASAPQPSTVREAGPPTGSPSPELPNLTAAPPTSPPTVSAAPSAYSLANAFDKALAHAEFFYGKRRYTSTVNWQDTARPLTIQNAEGHVLTVKLAERQGLLTCPGQPPQPVDLSEPHYFNLLRAGLNALDLKHKTRLLMKQDELLAEKDRQIEMLSQQVRLLEGKISQLSSEKQQKFQALQTDLTQQETAIQDQEAQIAQLQTQISRRQAPDPQAIQRQVRETLGDSIWFCIRPETQKDLCAAYRNYGLIQADGPDPHIADYSEAGLRLGMAVEREVLQPFFNDLHDFLGPQGIGEIAGISLGPTHHHPLGLLPALLAEQWQGFQESALQQSEGVAGPALYAAAVASQPVSACDRTLLNDFFQQWEHPLAACFAQKGKQAASSLGQISQLRNLAAHAERFLYEWQYDLLRGLILGNETRRGLFKQIYGG
jgi:single-stranded-DNA-specific exonuclease RecJ